jgi:hypothetical protein
MASTHYLIGAACAAIAFAPVQANVFGQHNRDCIPQHTIRAETAETESSLIFHTNGGRAYRNALPAPCDGLLGVNDLGTLGLKGTDDQLCAGDVVWMKHAGIASALGVAGAPDDAGCKLGAFEPISEMSLTEALRR